MNIRIDGYRAEVEFDYQPPVKQTFFGPGEPELFDIIEVRVAGKRRPWLERRIENDDRLRDEVEREMKRAMEAEAAAMLEP